MDENGNSRVIIDEEALESLVRTATNGDCPLDRATRAAQVANIIQPDVSSFKDAGEMFLLQVVYSPIVELFCAFSKLYCANKEVTGAHAIYCHEQYRKRVQYTASCSPSAALRLESQFYLIAMMMLSNGDIMEDTYQRDYYQCTLMTTMSAMAIVDYFVQKCKYQRADIDIAIPFMIGTYEYVSLHVIRLQGDECPKIHHIMSTKFGSSHYTSEKLQFLSTLSILLARIVETTATHKIEMASYFDHSYSYRADAINRNAIPDDSS
jgi:hypothetical protein